MNPVFCEVLFTQGGCILKNIDKKDNSCVSSFKSTLNRKQEGGKKGGNRPTNRLGRCSQYGLSVLLQSSVLFLSQHSLSQDYSKEMVTLQHALWQQFAEGPFLFQHDAPSPAPDRTLIYSSKLWITFNDSVYVIIFIYNNARPIKYG